MEHLSINFGHDGAYVITGLPPGEECAYTLVMDTETLKGIAEHHGFERPYTQAEEWQDEGGLHVFHHPSDVADTRGYGLTLQSAIIEADEWYDEEMYTEEG